MQKTYRVAAAVLGVLMLAGAGCGGASDSNGESVVNTVKKELRGKGDMNATMSASEKERTIADLKKITNEVFGASKLTAQMENDLVVKKTLSMSFTAPQAADASQQGAVEAAFKKAGYQILDKEKAGPGGQDDEAYGGVVAERGNVVVYLIYEQGSKEIGYMAMSSEQYAYVENTDENGK